MGEYRKYKCCHKLQVCFTPEQHKYVSGMAEKMKITKAEFMRQMTDFFRIEMGVTH